MALSAAGSGPRGGKRFPARFPGSCQECGDDIEAGEQVGYPKDGHGFMHASCADEVDEQEGY